MADGMQYVLIIRTNRSGILERRHGRGIGDMMVTTEKKYWDVDRRMFDGFVV